MPSFRLNDGVNLIFDDGVIVEARATADIPYAHVGEGVSLSKRNLAGELASISFPEGFNAGPIFSRKCRMQYEKWNLDSSCSVVLEQDTKGRYFGSFHFEEMPDVVQTYFESGGPGGSLTPENREADDLSEGTDDASVQSSGIPPGELVLEFYPPTVTGQTLGARLDEVQGHFEGIQAFIEEYKQEESHSPFEIAILDGIEKEARALTDEVEKLRQNTDHKDSPAVRRPLSRLEWAALMLKGIQGVELLVGFVESLVEIFLG